MTMTLVVKEKRARVVKIPIESAIAISLNVSLKESITGNEILKILHSRVLPENRIHHIGIMFNEIHPSELFKLLAQHNITFKRAYEVYLLLPKFYHTRKAERFFNEHLGNIA
jgi:hypothetical protein